MIFKKIFVNPQVLFVFKISLLILQGLYTFFAFVVVKQIGLMSRAFETPYGFKFKVISYIHLLVALSIFIISIVVL